MHTTEDHIALIIVRWIMLEPSSAAIPTLWPLLDAHEQAQADRFRGAADREAYVAAHALLRATLTRVAGIAPADWRFQASESGKPTLDPAQAPPDLHFSLSHTRGLVACAVGWPYTLGVDAEAWRPAAPIELATSYFAPTDAGGTAVDLLPALDAEGGLSQSDWPRSRGAARQLRFQPGSGRNRHRGAEFHDRLALCGVPARARAFARIGGAVAGANPDRRSRGLAACLPQPLG
jgi:hypothetical protein